MCHTRSLFSRPNLRAHRTATPPHDTDISTTHESSPSTKARIQPRVYREATLRARVPWYVLEGAQAPPFKRRLASRLFRAFRPRRAVKIEPLADGLAASVLYAREGSTEDLAPTQLASERPHIDDTDLVYQDSAYEIRVAGMFVRNFDRYSFSRSNELLLYSVQTDPTAGREAQSLPFIHYEYQRDASNNQTMPNTYIPIPASKSLVLSACTRKAQGNSAGSSQSHASKGKNGDSTMRQKPKKSINVQFRILEMDQPSELVKQAVSGIDDLGGFASSFASVAPFVGVLSPALGLASAVSKRALDSYARPDKVISIDMDFLLANPERVRSGSPPTGEYLRYGYYFFLSEPIEGRLYASVRTPKNVQLLFRRCSKDRNAPMTWRGSPVVARKYFPLTQVSYLVVRVTEPTGAGTVARRPVQIAHARQLETLFKQASYGEDAIQIRNALQTLGKELGVLDMEDEDDP